MRGAYLLILVLNFTCLSAVMAQDSLSSLDKLINFPTHFTEHINKKSEQLEERLTHQTEHYPTKPKPAFLMRTLYIIPKLVYTRIVNIPFSFMRFDLSRTSLQE